MLNTEGEGAGGTASVEEVATLTPLTPRAVWQLFLALTVSFGARRPDASGGSEQL